MRLRQYRVRTKSTSRASTAPREWPRMARCARNSRTNGGTQPNAQGNQGANEDTVADEL